MPVQTTTTAQRKTYGPGVYREQGGDVLRFRGLDALLGVPECLLWGNAPVLQCLADPSLGHYFFDDFQNPASATASDYHAYASVDDAGTGTNAFQNVAGGVYNVVTAGADNDYHAMTTVNEIFNLGLSKKMWFEARVKLAEATTSESTWWVGLTDTTTTGGVQANTAGPLADYDGCLWWKTPETALTLNFEVSNGATQDTESAIATSVSDTWTRVGFYYDGGDGTTGTITPYYSVDGTSPLAAGPAVTFLLASMTASKIVFGVKAGPTAAAETLQVDYIRALQLR